MNHSFTSRFFFYKKTNKEQESREPKLTRLVLLSYNLTNLGCSRDFITGDLALDVSEIGVKRHRLQKHMYSKQEFY